MDCKGRAGITAEQARELLERYFDGTTSLGEEQALRDYFSTEEDVPAELRYAKALFGYFREAAGETGASLRMEDIEERRERSVGPKARSRRIFYAVACAAAAAAVVVMLHIRSAGIGDVPAGETVYCYVDGKPVTDRELATQYTEEALKLLGESLNEPAQYLAQLSEFGHAMEEIAEISRVAGGMIDLEGDNN